MAPFIKTQISSSQSDAVFLYTKNSTRISWYLCGKDVFYIGPALRHYHTFLVIAKDKKHQQFSNTFKFQHYHLSQPSLTPEHQTIHAISILTCAIMDAPAVTCNAQIGTINYICNLFFQWRDYIALPSTVPSTRVAP